MTQIPFNQWKIQEWWPGMSTCRPILKFYEAFQRFSDGALVHRLTPSTAHGKFAPQPQPPSASASRASA